MDYQKFSRRDFLKLLLLLPFAANNSIHKITLRPLLFPTSHPNQPNILFFLFDALSARNISLYGYPRETMPNLAKFAELANVYHQHHSSGNWTPPGTASLLTGTYPWTHRNLSLYSEVLDSFTNKNLFKLLNNSHNTLAYTQNPLVQTLLHHFKEDIDDLLNLATGGVYNLRPEGALFNNDYSYAFWGQNVVQGTWEFPASSPFLSILNEVIFSIKYKLMNRDLQAEYPYSISTVLPGLYVFLDEAVNWLKGQLANTDFPSFSYYHFFPPHDPYAPRVEFSNLFDDDWIPPQKPTHIYRTQAPPEFFGPERRRYDQFIANCDYDFGIVIDYIQELGLMDNTYIIFTTDHGESFERDVWGHYHPLLYEPLIHIPLLIHQPGQTSREDIYTPTSAVDVLPTICQIVGQDIPDWVEGEVLPGFRHTPLDPQRPIFSVEAKENNKFGPLTIATISMIKWPYKLIHYFGYERLPYHFELYNLEEDPEELDDLYPYGSNFALEMEKELLEKIDQVNQDY
jgi:arylsulfatase A-like enzyme